MIALLVASLAVQQAAPPAAPTTSADARIALDRFGACVADRGHLQASRTLRLDFTTPEYDRALRTLVQQNRRCVGRNRTARIAGVLAAGAVAEGMLERKDGELLARLPDAVVAEAGQAFSPGDAAMRCVVRREPAGVARLFASAPATAAETAAVRALTPTLAGCLDAGRTARLNTAGLRATLAAAAYRIVTAAPPAAKS